MLTAVIVALVVATGSTWWTLLVGLGIPVVVEALTKAGTSPRVKGSLAIVAAALVAVVNLIATSGSITATLLVPFALTYGAQLLGYLGFWKPVVGLTGSILPSVGIGSAQPDVPTGGTLDDGTPMPTD